MKVFKVKRFVEILNGRSLEIKYTILIIFFILGCIILFQPKTVYNYEGEIHSYNNMIYNYEISFLSDDALLVSLKKQKEGEESTISSTHLFDLLKLNESTFLLSLSKEDKNVVDSDSFDPLFHDLAKVSFYRYKKANQLIIQTDLKYVFFNQVFD